MSIYYIYYMFAYERYHFRYAKNCDSFNVEGVYL